MSNEQRAHDLAIFVLSNILIDEPYKYYDLYCKYYMDYLDKFNRDFN